MLPDFPETKNLFHEALTLYMQRKSREISPFRDVRQTKVHEGDAMQVARADGSRSESSFRTLSAELTLQTADIENLTLQKVIEFHDKIIEQMVREKTKFTLEMIDRDLPRSQTAGEGRRFDATMLLDALEKIQIDFHPDGTMHQLNILGGAIIAERWEEAKAQFEASPELQQRYAEIVRRKREDWRDREASRTLVG